MASGQLDRTVVAALAELTEWVCLPLGRKDHRERSMRDRHARDAAIWTFKHLHRAGHEIPAHVIRRWALEHGWPDEDAWILSDYALGVAEGLRYHAGGDPWGPESSIDGKPSRHKRLSGPEGLAARAEADRVARIDRPTLTERASD